MNGSFWHPISLSGGASWRLGCTYIDHRTVEGSSFYPLAFMIAPTDAGGTRVVSMIDLVTFFDLARLKMFSTR